MSTFSIKISSVLGPFLVLDPGGIGGASGPRIKSSGGVIEIRETDDSAFQITRSAIPTNSQDFVTKEYLDQNSAIFCLRTAGVPLPTGATGDNSQDSLVSLTVDDVVFRAIVDINGPYVGTAPTISVGQSDDVAKYIKTTDLDATLSDLTIVDQITASIEAPMRVTLAGSATSGGGNGTGTAGSGTLSGGAAYLWYSVPFTGES